MRFSMCVIAIGVAVGPGASILPWDHDIAQLPNGGVANSASAFVSTATNISAQLVRPVVTPADRPAKRPARSRPTVHPQSNAVVAPIVEASPALVPALVKAAVTPAAVVGPTEAPHNVPAITQPLSPSDANAVSRINARAKMAAGRAAPRSNPDPQAAWDARRSLAYIDPIPVQKFQYLQVAAGDKQGEYTVSRMEAESQPSIDAQSGADGGQQPDAHINPITNNDKSRHFPINQTGGGGKNNP